MEGGELGMNPFLEVYLDHFPRLLSLALSLCPLLASRIVGNELNVDEALAKTLHEGKITQQQLREMVVCWLTKVAFLTAGVILVVNVVVGGLVVSGYLLLIGLPAVGLLVWGYSKPAYRHCEAPEALGRRRTFRTIDVLLALLVLFEATFFQIMKMGAEGH